MPPIILFSESDSLGRTQVTSWLWNTWEIASNSLSKMKLLALWMIWGRSGSYFKLFEFLEKEAYPKLKSRGLNTQAFIISNDLLVANITEKLMELFSRLNIKAQTFTDFDEAKTWLKEKTDA